MELFARDYNEDAFNCVYLRYYILSFIQMIPGVIYRFKMYQYRTAKPLLEWGIPCPKFPSPGN